MCPPQHCLVCLSMRHSLSDSASPAICKSFCKTFTIKGSIIFVNQFVHSLLKFDSYIVDEKLCRALVLNMATQNLNDLVCCMLLVPPHPPKTPPYPLSSLLSFLIRAPPSSSQPTIPLLVRCHGPLPLKRR